MARIAQFGRSVYEHLGIICSMDVVTSGACSPGRLVNELELLQFVLGNLIMANAMLLKSIFNLNLLSEIRTFAAYDNRDRAITILYQDLS